MKCSCGNDKFKRHIMLVSKGNVAELAIKEVCTACGLVKPEDATDAEYGIF